MNFLGVLVWIVSNAPTLIGLVRDFLAIIKTKPVAEQLAAKQELREAVKGKDAAAVAEVLHRHCSGVGCVADVVTE